MEYREQVKEWLDTPTEKRDLETGAKLMVQGNRNKILYNYVLKKSNFDKIQYELLKIFTANSPKEIDPIIIRLTAQINEKIETLPDVKGKRTDHDMLPPLLQLAYVENLKIYPRMRSLHEKLKVLTTNGTAAERIDCINELLELDSKLRQNWNDYDGFNTEKNIDIDIDIDSPKINITAKQVSAARKYLSDNKAKQIALVNSGDTTKAELLLEKMQNRFWELKSNGETFDPTQLAELKALGIETE